VIIYTDETYNKSNYGLTYRHSDFNKRKGKIITITTVHTLNKWTSSCAFLLSILFAHCTKCIK